jgi:hypothetical protein
MQSFHQNKGNGCKMLDILRDDKYKNINATHVLRESMKFFMNRKKEGIIDNVTFDF